MWFFIFPNKFKSISNSFLLKNKNLGTRLTGYPGACIEEDVVCDAGFDH